MRLSNLHDGVHVTDRLSIPLAELRFEFSRGGGPGGQHVNKVSTRVDLLFSIQKSTTLSASQKERLRTALQGRLDRAGTLRLSASAARSQWQNREEVLSRFVRILRAALKPYVPRVPTKPTSASKARRRKAKSLQSRKKKDRTVGDIQD